MLLENRYSKSLTIRSLVNLDVLQRIQDSFAEAIGFAAMVVDRRGIPVTRGSSFQRLCQMNRATQAGLARCSQCDREGGLEAQLRKVPVVYTCKAGLVDIAAPVFIEGEYLCSVHCGQVIPADSHQESVEEVIRRNEKLGLTKNEMEGAISEIPVIPRKRIDAAADTLFVLANYIVEMGAAHLKQSRQLEETQIRAMWAESEQLNPLSIYGAGVRPSFLINSLGLIGYMAVQEKAPQTEEMVYCLSDLLQYNLRGEAYPVTLRRDLEIVERYLHLQKIRFGERLKVHLEIDSAALQVQLPCLVIQPLVNNTIVQAVEATMNPVTVQIRVRLLPGALLLEVTDDGLAGEASPSGDARPHLSLHIQHVLQRLSLEYEDALKIEIDSAPGSGTRCRLTIPLRG